jgi:hypothetical protein
MSNIFDGTNEEVVENDIIPSELENYIFHLKDLKKRIAKSKRNRSELLKLKLNSPKNSPGKSTSGDSRIKNGDNRNAEVEALASPNQTRNMSPEHETIKKS